MFQWIKNLFVRERVVVVTKRAKVKAKKRKPTTLLVQSQKESLEQDYCNGVSCPKLARKYGVHLSTVYNILEARGVYTPKRRSA